MKSKKIEEASVTAAVTGFLGDLKSAASKKNLDEKFNIFFSNIIKEAKLHDESDSNDRESVDFDTRNPRPKSDKDENETAGVSVRKPEKEKQSLNRAMVSTEEMNAKIRSLLLSKMSSDDAFKTEYEGLLSRFKKDPNDEQAEDALRKIRQDLASEVKARSNVVVPRSAASAASSEEKVKTLVSKIFNKVLQSAAEGKAPSQEMVSFARDILNIDLRPSQKVFQSFQKLAKSGVATVSDEDVSKFVEKAMANPNSKLEEFAKTRLGGYPSKIVDKVEDVANKENVPGEADGGIGGQIKKLMIADPEYVKQRQILQRSAASGDRKAQHELTKLNADFEKNLIPQLKDVIVGRANSSNTSIGNAIQHLPVELATKLYNYFSKNQKEVERAQDEERKPLLGSQSKFDAPGRPNLSFDPNAEERDEEDEDSILNKPEKTRISREFKGSKDKFERDVRTKVKSRMGSMLSDDDDEEEDLPGGPDYQIDPDYLPRAKDVWKRFIDPDSTDKKSISRQLIDTLSKNLSKGDTNFAAIHRKAAQQARAALDDAESDHYDVLRKLGEIKSFEAQRGGLRPDQAKQKEQLISKARELNTQLSKLREESKKAEIELKLVAKNPITRNVPNPQISKPPMSPQDVSRLLRKMVSRDKTVLPGTQGDVNGFKSLEDMQDLSDEERLAARKILYMIGPDRLKYEKPGTKALAASDLSASRFLEPAIDDYSKEKAENELLNTPEEKREFEERRRRNKERLDAQSKSPKSSMFSPEEAEREEEESIKRKSDLADKTKSRLADLKDEKKKHVDAIGGNPKDLLAKNQEEVDSVDDSDKNDELASFKKHVARKRQDELRKKVKAPIEVKTSGGNSYKMPRIDRINNLEQLPSEKNVHLPGRVDPQAARARLQAAQKERKEKEINALLSKFSESKDLKLTSILELLYSPGKSKLVHADAPIKHWGSGKSEKKMKLVPDFAKQTLPGKKKKKKKS